MLGMRMEIRQRLALVCTACDKPSDTHDERCPTFHIDELLINEPTYYCEGACSGQVHVDTDDFLKCRECLTRYSLGMFADTENPRHVFLHRVRPDEKWVEAHVLAACGKRGGFKLDLKVKALREQEKIWRKRRRDEKAAARAARAAARRP